MLALPRVVVNSISNNIDERLKKRCFEYIINEKLYNVNKDIIFEEFIIDFMNDNFQDNFKYEDYSSLKDSTYRANKKTKKRWLSYVKEEVNNIDYKNLPSETADNFVNVSGGTIVDEIKLWNNFIKLYGIEKFMDTFKASSIEEALSYKFKELEEWSTNPECYISDFIYLNSKTKNRIETAIKSDILLLIVKIIIRDYDGQISNAVIDRADALVDNPIFADGKVLLPIGDWLETQDVEEVAYSDYIVDDEFILRTIMSNKLNKNLFAKQNFALDEKDSAIINYAVTKIDELFYKEKTVEVEIGELVEHIYSSRGGLNYDEVENRILKIGSYQVSGILKKDGNIKDTLFLLNFFQSASVKTDETTGKRIAVIVFSDLLHQQYIKKKTVRVYSNKMKSLSIPLSTLLIYCLQKERINCYTKKKPYSGLFSYKWFRYKVRFREKKEENMKLLAESLNEFKNKRIIIQDFRRVRDSFEIEFLPLSSYEIEDYFDNNNKQYLIDDYLNIALNEG
ncbi:MAG: hypothetical protein K0R54_26 [Clostridiaceae bacterium]|jgi:hypothetical protein|nr:hypothetical protein [Clostridiaceae bacterium]